MRNTRLSNKNDMLLNDLQNVIAESRMDENNKNLLAKLFARMADYQKNEFDNIQNNIFQQIKFGEYYNSNFSSSANVNIKM